MLSNERQSNLDDEENGHNDANDAAEEQGDTHALDSDGDGEIGDMFMLQEDSDEEEDVHEDCGNVLDKRPRVTTKSIFRTNIPS